MGLFDSFTGKSQRRDLQQAYESSSRALQSGYDDGMRTGREYHDRATAYLDPYAAEGRGANRLLSNALGVNGRDAQRGFYGDFADDPGWQDEVDYRRKALERSAAARGGLYSGALLNRVGENAQTMRRGLFQDRLGRLSQLGQQGYGAAGAQAGMTSQFGNTAMNMRYGLGATQAGNAINYGNATAQSRSVPWNNLMGLADTAMKAYTGRRV